MAEIIITEKRNTKRGNLWTGGNVQLQPFEPYFCSKLRHLLRAKNICQAFAVIIVGESWGKLGKTDENVAVN